MRVKSKNGKWYGLELEFTGNVEFFGEKLPKSFFDFLPECGHATAAVKAIVADPRDGFVKTVGAFRWSEEILNRERQTVWILHAAGTWVHRDFRQQGIARAMWNQVINQTPTYADQRLVSAVGITAAGKGFLESMARTYGPDAFGAYQ